VTRDEVRFSNRIYWTLTLVTTNNYGSLTDLNTPKVTVTAAQIRLSLPSVAVIGSGLFSFKVLTKNL
jgi:hypothetical protein